MISRINKKKKYHEVAIFEAKQGMSGTTYTPSNDMVLFCSVSGYGKSLALERTAYEYYRNGYTVINLTDVKLNFETCFSMLPAEKIVPEFHRFKVEDRQGDELVQVPMKIYHPFTFNISSRAKLPDMKVFTLPIKSLRREHFSFLSEMHTSSESVKLMLDVASSLKTTDGIYDFMQNVSELLDSKSSSYRGKKVKKINDDFFTTESTSGTMKDYKIVHSLFKPFKQDYFLASDTCPRNLNFVDMINDQKHYHNLTYKWIKDDKMRYFAILSFLLGIEDALDYAKNPIVIVIDEIRRLVPDKSSGYKEFLAEIIKNMLSTIRNRGRGVSVLCGSQEFFDIEEDVRNSFTEIYLGRIPPQDIERLSKIHSWNQRQRRMMTTLKKNHFHRLGDAEIPEYTMLFPPHAHKEPRFNFFEMYKRYFPFMETTYSDVVTQMKKRLDSEIRRAKDLAKKKDKKLKEDIKRQQEEKNSRSSVVEEVKRLKEEKRQERESTKEELMKQCYDMYNDPILPEPPSFREIGRKLGLSFPTVKTYIQKYSEQKKEQESRPQL